MLKYSKRLKSLSRNLRNNSTDSERILWSRLRRKQILGVPVYRQKPIGNYIVDFYAPQVSLVIEIDGSQHLDETHILKDKQRDEYLRQKGLKVLRFNNMDIFGNIDGVMDQIYQYVSQKLGIDKHLQQ
jgi:very-short-patch-repair endonuclease